MSIKIAIFDAKEYDTESFDKANDEGKYEIKYFETRLSEDTANLAKGFDVVCIFVNDVANRNVIDILCEIPIKIIALRCAGYNNVDIEYAYGKIRIVRVPSYSPHAVAEHAMALLLTLVRKTHKSYIRTRDFNFSLNGLKGIELYGKTVGVVGTGKIGRAFIDICKGFRMNVLAYDIFPDENLGIEYSSLEDIWKKSDIISFHCPLTEETRHMINEESIDMLKKGVIIINTSRGSLIDSEALLEGIKNKYIGAAGLDVYEEESDVFFHDYSGQIIEDDILARLISMPNVIVSSHQAYLTEEALSNIAATTLNNIEQLIKEGTCDNEIKYVEK